MEIDPIESVKSAEESRDVSNLGTWVAITVALLSTFLGICKVKDDNIVQAMQQAQADKVDHWSFYQARNIRREVALSTLAQLEINALSATSSTRAAYEAAMEKYRKLAEDESAKKEELKQQAEEDQHNYDALNYRDDQFDLSDTLVAIAISMLALTALTHKRWLFWLAMVPTASGVFMGLAGLMAWHVHPDALMKLLS